MNDKTYEVTVGSQRFEVTQAQVDACKRKKTLEGMVYYEVGDFDPHHWPPIPVTMIVTFNRQGNYLVCRCSEFLKSTCWHRRAALVAEWLYWQAQREQK